MTREERDKAIRILQWLHNNNFLFRSTEEDVKFATEYAIKALDQEPNIGHWILTDDDFVYCSECEDSYYPRPIDASWNYCPHCGAKMVDSQESEEE